MKIGHCKLANANCRYATWPLRLAVFNFQFAILNSQFSISPSVVTIFLDCDSEGEAGMKQALGYLAQLIPVRLAWTSNMHGGKFKGRQPESLTGNEWIKIRGYFSGS